MLAKPGSPRTSVGMSVILQCRFGCLSRQGSYKPPSPNLQPTMLFPPVVGAPLLGLKYLSQPPHWGLLAW